MRVVRKFAKANVPYALVERPGLKFMGVEPRAVATTRDCLLLCKLHELCSDPTASQLGGDDEKLDVEPAIACSAPHATDNLAFCISQCNYQWAILARACLALVVLDKRRHDLFANLFVGYISDGKRVFHSANGSVGDGLNAKRSQ